ncbi:MAG: DUF6291 domain-containing protein [Eubacteriales bacterium]
MRGKEKGFLLFYDWFKYIEKMSHKDAHMLINALVRYQTDGAEPPEFSDKIKDIAGMMFDQLRRRMEASEHGKKGRAIQLERMEAESERSGTPAATPATQDKDIDKDEYTDRDEDIDLYRDRDQNKTFTLKESETRPRERASCEKVSCGDAACAANSLSEKEEEDEGDRRYAYGTHKNVYLTEGEYGLIKRTIPDAEGYINGFSEKLYSKGYQYRDHYAAIMSWWQSDKDLPPRPARQNAYSAPETNSGYECTFSDSFFEAAVRRALGDA